PSRQMRQQHGGRLTEICSSRRFKQLEQMLTSARELLAPSRRSEVPPFMVMDVMAAAARLEAAGIHVVHMEVGQPAAAAPATALAAARAALGGGGALTGGRRTGAPRPPRAPGPGASPRGAAAPGPGVVAPARVIVTPGSSAGFMLAFLSLFEPGERVAFANPGYPPYRHILKALGCEPVLIETDAATRWALDPAALIAAHRARPLAGVLVESPANPTGTMMTGAALGGLIAAAEDAGIRFISDEIYHGLDYAFAAVTAAALSASAVVINSFSKYFCMTGWRIGWMVVPEPLVRPIERLQQNLAIS